MNIQDILETHERVESFDSGLFDVKDIGELFG